MLVCLSEWSYCCPLFNFGKFLRFGSEVLELRRKNTSLTPVMHHWKYLPRAWIVVKGLDEIKAIEIAVVLYLPFNNGVQGRERYFLLGTSAAEKWNDDQKNLENRKFAGWLKWRKHPKGTVIRRQWDMTTWTDIDGKRFGLVYVAESLLVARFMKLALNRENEFDSEILNAFSYTFA